jgi:hypothetical protein
MLSKLAIAVVAAGLAGTTMGSTADAAGQFGRFGSFGFGSGAPYYAYGESCHAYLNYVDGCPFGRASWCPPQRPCPDRPQTR